MRFTACKFEKKIKTVLLTEQTCHIKKSHSVQTIRFVSHEIRSPLSIVSAGLDILLQDYLTAEPSSLSGKVTEIQDLTQDIADAADAAVGIVNDLLQYESMDAGLFKIETARVRPADIMKPNTFAMIAKRNSIDLKMVSPENDSTLDDDCFVIADIFRLEQVLRNLVTNACKCENESSEIIFVSITFLC
jgi:ribose transport system substrate-binding protein